MVSKKSRAIELEPQEVNVEDLLFDPHNPRIAGTDRGENQTEILKTLWKRFAVDEIALSIAENQFFRYEPLFAVPAPRGKYYVIEGNRRLAAVQLLRNPKLREEVGATDLPKVTKAEIADLDTLPVIVCARDQVWQHLGFKHVNGPQAWNADSKADYIAWVHNELRISLEDIAATIGDRNRTVERLYQARQVLSQAENAKVFDKSERYKSHFSFSHLYTGLGYAGIQSFLGISDKTPPDSKEPVKSARLKRLGQLLGWMYGDRSKSVAPLIKSQNPDLRYLDEVIQSDEGVVALERGLPLQVSLDIARGDERQFREAIQATKQNLQRALGTLVTGYNGEKDALAIAGEIVKLAEKLLSEMSEKRADGAGGSRTRMRE